MKIFAASGVQIVIWETGMGGRLEARTRACYEQMRSVMSAVLACIDFPDEDLAEMSREDMIKSLQDTRGQLQSLAETYRTGHAVAEGIATVICGRTNVGKSSLYNALLGRDAAIVTDIEGTTRDVLCETTTLGSVTLRLYDTAGLRETNDPVERIGIDRARAAMDEAELILAQLAAPEMAAKLEEVLTLARKIIRCDVLEEPLEDASLCGLTEAEIRQRSHVPQEYYGQPHFMPEGKDDLLLLQINLARAMARKTELQAVHAFSDREGNPTRPDILQAMNRISSMLYIFMIQEKSRG